MFTNNKPIYVGAHLWIVPAGATFTHKDIAGVDTVGSYVVSQNGDWPGAGQDWSAWALAAVKMASIDPKYGPQTDILEPSPGQLQATDSVIPYALPEMDFTLQKVPTLAPQLALNTQQLWATATTQFNPNGANGPGLRAIIKCQKYSQDNVKIIDWMSWSFIQLKGALKFDPKVLTEPEFTAKLLYSVNNTGTIA